MADVAQDTMTFPASEQQSKAKKALIVVYKALEEKGYDPVTQLEGYLLSGDPTYITNHDDARNIIRRLDRDEIFEELIISYLKDALKR